MTHLSSAAQAVMDAVHGRDAEPYPLIVAAALRAAADHVEHHWDGFECVDYLCGLADELDPPNS